MISIKNYLTHQSQHLHRTRTAMTIFLYGIGLVHTDVCGPIVLTSRSGKCYCVSLINDFTHFAILYPIREKSDTFNDQKKLIRIILYVKKVELYSLKVISQKKYGTKQYRQLHTYLTDRVRWLLIMLPQHKCGSVLGLT